MVAGLLLTGLSACVEPPSSRQTAPAALPAQPDNDANGLTLRQTGPLAPREEPRRTADPRVLVGLTGAEVADLLGRPGFVRRDAPAEIWQYRGGDCVLDVFLYTEPGGARVQHVELRARQLTQSTTTACFAGLLGRVQPARYSGS